MKRTIAALLIFGLTLAIHASSIDLSRMTYQEFLASNKSGVFGQQQRRIQNHLGWLDGYYKDEQDPPVINSDALVANLNKLNEYCAAKPAVRLITAADELFHK